MLTEANIAIETNSSTAEALEATMGKRGAAEIIEQSLKALFPGHIALVSSFGADSAVLLHMVSTIAPDLPVLFLETGKHFAETLSYRDRLVDYLGLSNVQSITPDPADLDRDDPDGRLHRQDAVACCHLRKVVPLERALAPYAAWISGRKRFQASTRSRLAAFEDDGARIKVNPLAHWSAKEIHAYMRTHALPQHPLIGEGYLSIGCAPCTARVAPGADPRSGRWQDSDKTECGIHIVNGRVERASHTQASAVLAWAS